MLILALETTGDVCSAAVHDASGLAAERAFRHRMHLSDRLHVDVDALLADAGVTLQQVEAFAVGLGPGSFTGVRVGVTTVKTWADVLGRPACGANSLTLLAEEYAGAAGLVVPVVRSRPGELHAQPHRWNGDEMVPLEPPATFTPPDLAARLAGAGPVLLCGPGLRRGGEALRAALQAAGAEAALGRDDDPRASVAAAVAARRLRDGRGDDPLALVPLYVAPPPIGPPGKRVPGP